MNEDPMKLVRFMCMTKAHADGRSESALTIHQGSWAFCPEGGGADGHEWAASDGLPFSEAMRFTPRQQALFAAGAVGAASAPAAPAAPATMARTKGTRSG
jgi:hypothetical protein